MSGPNKSYDPVQVTPLNAEHVEAMVAEALAAFAAATTVAELKQARIAHAGDRSPLALANREIGALPPQARKDVGQRIGRARGEVNQALKTREAEVTAAELARVLVEERVDVTLPVELTPQGAVHPITALMDRMCDVFVAMGWEVAEGPELEAEWLNFDALNFIPDHPARTMQDTLFADPADSGVVLRTHTSPVQARSLLTRELPVYVVCPGKVYRADEYDATHVPVFHQIEGLCVDKGITLAHLRGTLDYFAQAMFGDTRTRIRPNYFPFTEPSAEVDLQCFVCHGASVGNPDNPCRTCASEGWIEWGGCGVVNPRVLQACGVDTDVYSGFAFGMGVERTLMFRNNAEDMRDMIEGDVRFSRSLVGGAR
ncbi:phenylalanine--tRNA ligase subunit alpha [Microlunatus panaciterrae]|uniref:Phenylalanine--tRNA ligase alpha subunit n=1 Tax=Microlunatus panaciterrae TaxID=400768 RepID=A0ABS2RN59_9ACTN|nr:phenylalanine--tRNA ligase subunit alpha [Microlunatus panaciterrae]MBM7800444.1 phenylalanyl-tRNA synthetase alpha chain [Microlunatus panaciterrae]